MSKRAYPQDPAVPTQPSYPMGRGTTSGNYPGQHPYQSFPGQPGPPRGTQPPTMGGGGGGYPRQQYPSIPSSQGWGAPPPGSTLSGYGPPGQTMHSGHGGYNTAQSQQANWQKAPMNYQAPPSGPPPSTGGMSGPLPSTGGISGPPPSTVGMSGPPPSTVGMSGPPLSTGGMSGPLPSTGGMSGPPSSTVGMSGPPLSTGGMSGPTPPPPVHAAGSGAAVSQTPPSSVASMTTGVGQMLLGSQPSGMVGPSLSNQLPPPPTSTSLAQGPPPTLSNFPPPPTTAVSAQGTQPLSQARPSYPAGLKFPPPPTSSGQGLPPPPTSSGQIVSGQQLPPPPSSSGQPLGQGLPPPPTSSGQQHSGQPMSHPQMVGHRYPPPPTGSGQNLPPPPISGQPGQPSTRPILPPPPTSEQSYPPPPISGQHPTSLGQHIPTTSGQVALPPSSTHRYTGQLPTGPPGPGGVPGQRPSLGPGQMTPKSQLGVPPPTPPYSGPGGMVQSDPNLQPVNLMENRNIIPSSPVVPPAITLPNNLSKFAPDHKVFCCTMSTVPATNSLLNKLKLPFAIHIHPFKDMTHNDCPVIHPSVIVRCRMCRAYINPYVTFIDSRHWRCNLCFRPNSLPEDFDYNPHSGKHGDRSHRVELKRSSVEYIAPSEYMVRPPQPCVFYFLIDVSFNAVQTGLLGVVCKCLLENIERLPGDARTMVGILTYDSSLHFYNLNSELSQPQMLVVSDINDVFLPCPDSLLVTLKDSKELIRTLLEDLPRMFAENKSVHSALGAALQAATKLLHPIGGRITVLQTSIPNIGPGALKYRDVTPSSTKIDSLSMSPASDFYKKLALDCSSQQIAVDLFAFGGQFMDLTTMSCISKFSSGQVSYYPDFHHKREVHREKFERDFKRYLTRKIGFEAVMRIRCTDGLSLHTFHGNFFVRSTDLLSLPNVNPDHGFTMNLAIDENLKEISMVCFQAALLYTSSRGERRIRVHTLSLPVSNQLSDIYAKLNILAITGVLGNMAVDRAASSSLGDAREALMNTVIDSTKMYRSNFASSMQASQFTLPATLRLLPLFMISLLKSPAFSLNSKVVYDYRTHAMNIIKSTPLDYLMCLIYPRLYALHMLTESCLTETEDGKEELAPPILQLSAEKMTRYGIFLMDYGLGMYIWVSKDTPQALIQKIFGVQHFGAIPEVMTSLPQEENDISPLVNKLVKQIRTSRQIFVPLQVIREDGPHRLLFIDKMIDDRTEYGTSYYEFLTHISRQLSK